MKMDMNDSIEKLKGIHDENRLGGGQKWIDRQHGLGKLLARERIDCFVDPGTFVEIGSAVKATSVRIDGKVVHSPCDGAIIGHGKVDGRRVAIYASDFTVQAGSIGIQHMIKFDKLWDYAGKWGIPMVWLLDSAGGRLGQDDVACAGVEWFFWYEARYSGVVPQICVLMGPCIAGQAYAPCMTDFLLMTRNTAHLWLGGPRMTEAATKEKMDEVVGSADFHMVHSGTCDVVGVDDRDSIAKTRKLLNYLPSNYREKPPFKKTEDIPFREIPDLGGIVPTNSSEKYDVHKIIEKIVDDGDYFEIKSDYAKQLMTCFCRFDGHVVGLVASNPQEPGSILECNPCDKYYRFLEVLDAYGIPLINLVDTPPYVPGDEEEERGLLRHGGKIIHLYATSTIPKISIILRNAYCDAGSIIMGGAKGMGTDLCYAWPIAILGVKSSELDLKEIHGIGIEQDAYELYLDRPREINNVLEVAKTWSAQVVDEIIDPKDTRKKIIEALELTKDKTEKLPIKTKQLGVPPT
jgi:propionyl-CoA carboxylase beta chain